MTSHTVFQIAVIQMAHEPPTVDPKGTCAPGIDNAKLIAIREFLFISIFHKKLFGVPTLWFIRTGVHIRGPQGRSSSLLGQFDF